MINRAGVIDRIMDVSRLVFRRSLAVLPPEILLLRPGPARIAEAVASAQSGNYGPLHPQSLLNGVEPGEWEPGVQLPFETP